MSLIERFLTIYANKTPRELFHSEIRIISDDYDVEVNGIHVNKASKGNGDLLILETMNHRKLRLHITNDTEILINGKTI